MQRKQTAFFRVQPKGREKVTLQHTSPFDITFGIRRMRIGKGYRNLISSSAGYEIHVFSIAEDRKNISLHRLKDYGKIIQFCEILLDFTDFFFIFNCLKIMKMALGLNNYSAAAEM